MAKNEMLKRAYALRSKTEVKDLYRTWAGTYDDQLTNDLDYVGPNRTADVFSGAWRGVATDAGSTP